MGHFSQYLCTIDYIDFGSDGFHTPSSTHTCRNNTTESPPNPYILGPNSRGGYDSYQGNCGGKLTTPLDARGCIQQYLNMWRILGLPLQGVGGSSTSGGGCRMHSPLY